MPNYMPGLVLTGTLTDGNAQTVSLRGMPFPLTVWVQPTNGDTITVSYSRDNGASYTTWPAGAVTANSDDALDSGYTHLKFQRTAGSGATSTWGLC